jgi:hypothetical protein
MTRSMHDWPAGARKVVRSYDPARDPDYLEHNHKTVSFLKFSAAAIIIPMLQILKFIPIQSPHTWNYMQHLNKNKTAL